MKTNFVNRTLYAQDSKKNIHIGNMSTEMDNNRENATLTITMVFLLHEYKC